MTVTNNYNLDTDTTLGGNNASDYVIPSQKAIKDYVDNHSSTTDQTYTPTSTNAQSGVAIAGAGFLTSISSTNVTTALGYTPYNSSNPSGYITSSSLAPYQLIAPTVNVLATSGTVALTDNSINSITPSAVVTFTLPTVSDNAKFHQILVQVKLSTVYTLTLGTSYFFNATAPDMSTAGVYNLIYEYDKANQYWVVGAIPKGAAS